MRFFNKIWFCLLFLLPFVAKAQVNSYTFTQLSGTYTPITGGTVLGTTASDDQRFVDPAAPAGGTTTTGVGLPIGFNFTFNGVVFDRFAVNYNGWISLGQSALSPAVSMVSGSSYTPISATSTAPANLQNRIAAFGRDLAGQAGSELRFQTIGTAPNQVLVVQWSNISRYLATGDNITCQIRLYETTNVVEVVYGTNASGTTTTAPEVGLRGTTNTDFNNRSVVAGTNTWATSTAGAVNTATAAYTSASLPVSGQTYRWTPASCLAPTGLAATTPSPTSANFTWATSIPAGQVVVVPQGNAATTGTPVLVSGTSASNTTLTAATSYSVYIRRICGPGDTSNWSLAVNFTTPCVSLTPPWTESFEGVNVTPNPGGPLPNCWFRNVTDFATGNGTQSNNRSARTGTKYLYTAWSTAAGTGDWAWTPAFDLVAGRQYDFSFWYKVDGAAGFDTLKVGVGNAQTTAAMTIIGTPVYAVTNTGYQQYFVSYTPATSGTYYFGVNVWANGVPWYMTFDDFNLLETPTCPQPNTIAFPSLRADSTVITWNSPAPGNSWYYYIGAPATTPTGLGTLTTNNPLTINNLTPNTNYVFYVRELCGAGDTSAWSGPFAFTTDCAPSTAGDSITTAINVTTDNFSATGSTARCYTNTTGNLAPDVWYRVILNPCATQITASLCTGTSFDTYLRIYDQTGTTQIAFNDDGCGAQSVISNLNVTAYDTIYVLVEGFGSATGTYSLSLTQTAVTPTADIAYAASSYCQNGVNPIAMNMGSTGGVFSTNPSTLTLDPVNGELNLSTAMAGQAYQVVYTVGQRGCAAMDSFQVTVNAADNAEFNYSPATNESLCESNTAAMPSIVGLAGGSFMTSSANLSLDMVSGTIDASASDAGMHMVYYTTNGTCPNTDSVQVMIDTLEDATFDYVPTAVCNNTSNIMSALSGLAGGLYSSSNGLALDTISGEINVMMSAAGSYVVSYTLPNACRSQATDAITINAMDDATFSYNAAVYCQNGLNPVPVVTGLAGGAFASNTGLPVDIGTGTIDLSATSTNVQHTVIYGTNGICPNFSVVTVTVIPADTAEFAYDSTSYCLIAFGPNENPVITGNTGGTFSATGGLTINPTTGAFAIDSASANAGVYTIRYVTNGPTTCRDTATAMITLLDCFPTSVAEAQNAASYLLYPNPTSAQFNLVANNINGLVDLNLVDMLGRSVYSEQNVLLTDNNPHSVSLQNLPAGSYILRISNNSQSSSLPLMIVQP